MPLIDYLSKGSNICVFEGMYKAQIFAFGIIVRLFANGPEGRGLIPGRVIPKIQKMVLNEA